MKKFSLAKLIFFILVIVLFESFSGSSIITADMAVSQLKDSDAAYAGWSFWNSLNNNRFFIYAAIGLLLFFAEIKKLFTSKGE